MNLHVLPEDATQEITALIDVLHRTEQRLEELTSGQIDAVADHEGRAFMLRHPQDVLRGREAMTQVAILNALPAQVAMLDRQGVIVGVNDAWRRMTGGHAMQGPAFGVGIDYLRACERECGPDALEAHRMGVGIRSVLEGEEKSFSMQYPCHSSTQRRCFLLTVAPLSDDGLGGVVVMHADVTQREMAMQEQVAMRQLLNNIVENIPTAVQLKSVKNDFRIQLWNKAAEAMYGLPRNLAVGRNVYDLWPGIVADRMQAADLELLAERGVQDFPDRTVVKHNGETLQAHMRKVALLDESGDVTHVLVIADDITEQRRGEEDLRRFRSAMDAAADAIYMVDRASMRCLYANDAACRLFKHTRDDLLRIQPWDIARTSRAALERTYDAVIASGEESRPVEKAGRRSDGTQEWVEVRRHAQRSGEQWTIVVVARDISERKETAMRIAHLNRVRAVLSGINALIVRVQHPDELFTQGCRVAVEAGGFRMAWIAVADPDTKEFAVAGSEGVHEDLLAAINTNLRASEASRPEAALVAQMLREPRALVFNDLRGDTQGFGKKHLAAGILSVAVLPLTVSGATIGMLALCADEAGFFLAEEMKLLTELAGDIAFAMEHIDRKQRLDYLVYYDALTGLANRGLFLERLAQHMRSAAATGTRLALFLIDLERFKDINDSLGRPAGDALLRQVTDWLKLNAGEAPLLSRIGGDHFAVLLPDARQAAGLRHLLEKTIAAFVHHPFRLNDAIFRVAARAGAAIFPVDGLDAETLFKNAEAALKKAKAGGSQYLFYTQGMHERVAGRLTLETQLREALDREEFVLHYQPKINAVTGRISGAEALIRWNDPHKGLVPPGRFIPVLEDTGLIHEVGRWALRKAVADYLAWCTSGHCAVRIAVNVSALQLRHRDFIDEVVRAIGVDPLAAAGLELEITESVVMEDVKHSVSSLQAVRAMGVTVAIDDFGTGFSSLSYLSRLPVDALKIDHSFVTDMTADPQGLALVRTIIDLAHSLKLKVVAEGVETQEQSRLLRVLGCDELQGFLFSKALPRKDFETLFLAGPPG